MLNESWAAVFRLSEDPKLTVGVLEAGGYFPDEPLINVPGWFPTPTRCSNSEDHEFMHDAHSSSSS
jgi:hypothetical protein